MNPLRGRVVPVLLAVVVLVGGANLASYAAQGRPLLLGSTNSATKTTAVKNTGKGPALSLKSRGRGPSLAVSSRGKVTKLNADAVDGLDGTSLRTKVWTYLVPTSSSATSTFNRGFPGLPPGRYVATYAIVAQTSDDNANIFCSFLDPLDKVPSEIASVGSNFITLGRVQGLNGAGVLDTRKARYTLYCATDSGTMQVFDSTGARSQVTFERVDDVVATTSTSAPE